MFKKIVSTVLAFFRFFKKKPPVVPGATVIGVTVENIDGKRYRVTRFSDGKVERVEISDGDPTDVGGFLNDINRKP